MNIHQSLKQLFARISFPWRRTAQHTTADAFLQLDQDAFEGQRCLMKLHREHGPVFQSNREGRLTTYVLGHPRIRRLVALRKSGLPCETIDLRLLFPEGSIRAMDGPVHTDYKRKMAQAMQAVSLAEHEAPISIIIGTCLDEIGETAGTAVVLDSIATPLRAAASTVMIRILFGLDSQSERFAPIRDAYVRFSPGEPTRSIGPEQTAAFQDLRSLMGDEIRDLARGRNNSAPSSMLKQMLEVGNFDETLLGNLIYLHEASHYDSFSLWRWIIHYLAHNGDVVAQLRRTKGQEKRRLAGAIVLETLRLNQSEGLIRQVTESFEFEGTHIPSGTYLRACIWEGHKDPENFPDPFAFDPGRFLGEPLSQDVFAPFGLDQHHCIGAELEIFVSSLFVEELVRRFDIAVLNDMPSFSGRYHWQPHPQTSLQFTPVA